VLRPDHPDQRQADLEVQDGWVGLKASAVRIRGTLVELAHARLNTAEVGDDVHVHGIERAAAFKSDGTRDRW
jgi:hypothetical protein